MIKIRISRINNFEYSFKGSTLNGVRIVSKILTFKNNDPYVFKKYIQMFDRTDLTFKIGMLPTLIEGLKAENIEYEIFDNDYSFPKGIVIDERMLGKYIHQKKAVEAFLKDALV